MARAGSGSEQGKINGGRKDRELAGETGRSVGSRRVKSELPQNLKRVQVEIFGQKYNITGGDNPDRMIRIADFVNDQMLAIADKSKGISTLKIAILAALNISDQMLQFQEKTSTFRERGDRLIAMLTEIVDD